MKKSLIVLFFLFSPLTLMAKETLTMVSLSLGAINCQAAYLKPVPPKKGAVIFVQLKSEPNQVLLPQISERFSKRGLAVLILDLRSFNNGADCTLKEELVEAEAFLKEESYKKMAVLYYGEGGFEFIQQLYELNQAKPKKIQAMVLVSASSNPSDYAPLIEQYQLEKKANNRIPTFDISAEFDYASVFLSQEERQNSFDDFGAKFYRKLVLPGAAHDYMSFELPLANWASSYILARFKKNQGS